MKDNTSELYLQYDQSRKQQEAIDADLQDDKELKALSDIEKKLKHRPT